MADPSSYFLGVDDVADYTTYNLGFNVAFPHAIDTLFSAVINDDYSRYAPVLQADGSIEIPPLLESINAADGDMPGVHVGVHMIVKSMRLIWDATR